MFQPQAAVDYLRRHEGVVNYMYLDVVGLVTIGVGFLLPSAAAALALNLVRRDSGIAATDEEKRADWESVHARPRAELAANYRPFTLLDLPDSAIDGELSVRIEDFVRNLQSRFPQFQDFPNPAQVGIIDMVYGLGPAGLFRGFPKFCSAVDRKDWAACATEGIRGNVSQSRNQELQELFREAAAAKVT
jgi:GH24 family phage-related lysozyme (muramidase)